MEYGMTNKELVMKFYNEVFNNRDLTNLDNYMRDDYRQHNANVKDGKAGFVVNRMIRESA